MFVFRVRVPSSKFLVQSSGLTCLAQSRMKTEFTDVSETQKTVTIEIDSSVVDAEIDRVAQGL